MTLVQNGAEVDGVINAGLSNQTTVFSLTVDSSGNVVFTLDRSVENNSGPVSLPADSVTLTQTITDGDGTQGSNNIDISTQFSITDDKPEVAASGTTPALTLSEANLTFLTNGIDGTNPDFKLTHTSGNLLRRLHRHAWRGWIEVDELCLEDHRRQWHGLRPRRFPDRS